MATVITIVGKSGAGKTKLIENLLPEFNSLGLRVAVIKHTDNDFRIEHPEKDSHRIFNAGAWISMVASGQKISFLKKNKNPVSLKEIIKSDVFNDCDIILAEGFKREDEKKIVVYRDCFGDVGAYDGSRILFFVGDKKYPHKTHNIFNFYEIDKMVAFVLMYTALKNNGVFVGVGNSLKGDDGFGVEVIKKVKKTDVNRFIDAGIAPENYISTIVSKKPQIIIIFDALLNRKEDGITDLKAYSSDIIANTTISTHGMGIKMFISYLLEAITDVKIFLIGVKPERMSLSDEISPSVRKIIDEISLFFEHL